MQCQRKREYYMMWSDWMHLVLCPSFPPLQHQTRLQNTTFNISMCTSVHIKFIICGEHGAHDYVRCDSQISRVLQPNQNEPRSPPHRFMMAGWIGIPRFLSHCHPRKPTSTLLHCLNRVRNSTSSWFWLYIWWSDSITYARKYFKFKFSCSSSQPIKMMILKYWK